MMYLKALALAACVLAAPAATSLATMMYLKALALAACVLAAQGFTTTPLRVRKNMALRMAEEVEEAALPVEPAPAPVAAEAEEERPGLFDKTFFQTPSTRGMIGVSRDQDGKSNIWAVQPKMVESKDTQNGKRFAVGAAAAGGLVALCIVVAALIPNADQLY
eukprot:CAMPEP_0118851318 /NCGR_PEP_ID=MMETSP1163-20130328/806_1 /TAXON_ID=124430 /ORGANISM="Phaeomonas parva, Strain CCMP2877" /LENGTH=161 /DNA_ID=CAMNT_0006783637 /DNA_START=10 /DNA_END=495 /DNA_ORIENTATION=+